MFKPKTERIKKISELYPKVIENLESIFDHKTNIYIDYANVIRWQQKLNWHIDLRRLKQLLDSFDTIQNVNFYYGTLKGDLYSEQLIKDVSNYRYEVKTKPVKIMKLSIDVSSVSESSPEIIKNFLKKSLLRKLDLETFEFLNSKLKALNSQGIKFLEERKCNFDVEIGRDIFLDCEKNGIENFILWSGDSDFAEPVNQLLQDGKKAVIFITTGRLSRELSKTKAQIFDIRKIKEFICWPKELPKHF